MLKRRLGNHRGVSIIELVLVLPLLLAFMGFTVDFGLAFFVSHIAQNAVREGARLAMATPDLQPGPFVDQSVTGRIENLLPKVELFKDFTHTEIFNLAPCDVSVTVSGGSPYFFLPAFLASLPSAEASADGTIVAPSACAMKAIARRRRANG